MGSKERKGEERWERMSVRKTGRRDGREEETGKERARDIWRRDVRLKLML